MRPVATPQNSLRYPLNELLGREAHVRILRVLADLGEPVSAADLAERAELTLPGVRKALTRLAETGFVVRVGGGRRGQYALRQDDPLATSLVQLFRTERGRHRELLDAIRRALRRLSPPPRSAWVEGGGDRPGDPLSIGVLHDARTLSQSMRSLRSYLAGVEQEFDVTIDLSGYTTADLPQLDPDQITLLDGVPPAPAGPIPAARTHADLDRRSLAMHGALATLLLRDPSLVTRAGRHLDRVLAQDHGPAGADLTEWSDILRSYSLSRLLRFLTSTGERATRLRQSSPFMAVLSPAERDRLLAAVDATVREET